MVTPWNDVTGLLPVKVRSGITPRDDAYLIAFTHTITKGCNLHHHDQKLVYRREKGLCTELVPGLPPDTFRRRATSFVKITGTCWAGSAAVSMKDEKVCTQ
jgi:hypothetical protein